MTDPDYQSLFRDTLTRLGAVPITGRYAPGIGYVVNSDALELTALDSRGAPFILHRKVQTPRHAAHRRQFETLIGSLYEPVADREEEISLGQQLGIDEDAWDFVAFVDTTAFKLGAFPTIPIPAEVLNRDFVRESSEVVVSAYCYLSPSEHYCLAIHSLSNTQAHQHRLFIALYDSDWMPHGSISQVDSRRMPHFDFRGLFEVAGLELPVFVTIESNGCSFQRFLLNSFAPTGQHVTFALSNDTISHIGVIGCGD